MNAESFISILENSKNRILVKMASQLRGAINMNSESTKSILSIGENIRLKEKFERLLSSSIVHVEHEGSTYILSSNVILMHHLEIRRNAKNRNRVVKSIGRSAKFNKLIKSKNPNIVRTWDLVANDKYEIKLDSKWRILGWDIVSSDNIEILSDRINYILNKGKNEK